MNSTIHDQAWLTWGANLETRIRQLEKHIHYPHNEVAMKEAAAKAQAQPEPLQSYARMQAQTIISEAYPPANRESKHGTPILTDEEIFRITKEADFGDIEKACDGYPGDRAAALLRVRHLIALAYASPPEPMDSYARMQGSDPRHLPPMRADTEAILALTKFAKRLLNPEDLGHAVTFEVRQLARRALGLPEVKEYDL